MAEQQQNPDRLGALWTKSSPRGEFLAGSVTIDGKEHRIVVFKNERKQNPNHPDWNILKGRERE